MGATGDVGRGKERLPWGFLLQNLGRDSGIASGRTGKEEKKVCVQPTWFSGLPCWLAGGVCWSWGLGKSYRWGEAGWKGEICGIHRRWEQWGRGGCKGCSAAGTVGLDQGEQRTIKLLIARDQYSTFILQLMYRLQLINENSSKKKITLFYGSSCSSLHKTVLLSK